MNLELLSEFVTLAEYLNFSGAAQKLNMTQPTLSRHIVQLEDELDAQLFRRDRQSVSLTEVGKLFLPEARAVVERYESALRRIREYKDGMRGSLTIGYQWVYGDWLWLQILNEFRRQYPQVAAELISFPDAERLNKAFFGGSVDVAITLRNDRYDSSDFRLVPLHSVPLMVVMRNDHKLSGRDTVSLDELKGEHLVFPQASSYPVLPSWLSSLLSAYNMAPMVSYSSESIEDALLRVQMDRLMALVPECYLPHNGMPGLSAACLKQAADSFRLVVLSRADNRNPAIKLFFHVCINEIKKTGDA